MDDAHGALGRRDIVESVIIPKNLQFLYSEAIVLEDRTRSKMKSKFNEPMWRAKVDVFNLN